MGGGGTCIILPATCSEERMKSSPETEDSDSMEQMPPSGFRLSSDLRVSLCTPEENPETGFKCTECLVFCFFMIRGNTGGKWRR